MRYRESRTKKCETCSLQYPLQSRAAPAPERPRSLLPAPYGPSQAPSPRPPPRGAWADPQIFAAAGAVAVVVASMVVVRRNRFRHRSLPPPPPAWSWIVVVVFESSSASSSSSSSSSASSSSYEDKLRPWRRRRKAEVALAAAAIQHKLPRRVKWTCTGGEFWQSKRAGQQAGTFCAYGMLASSHSRLRPHLSGEEPSKRVYPSIDADKTETCSVFVVLLPTYCGLRRGTTLYMHAARNALAHRRD